MKDAFKDFNSNNFNTYFDKSSNSFISDENEVMVVVSAEPVNLQLPEYMFKGAVNYLKNRMNIPNVNDLANWIIQEFLNYLVSMRTKYSTEIYRAYVTTTAWYTFECETRSGTEYLLSLERQFGRNWFVAQFIEFFELLTDTKMPFTSTADDCFESDMSTFKVIKYYQKDLKKISDDLITLREFGIQDEILDHVVQGGN